MSESELTGTGGNFNYIFALRLPKSHTIPISDNIVVA